MDQERQEKEKERYEKMMAQYSNQGDMDEDFERKINYRLCTIDEVPEWIKAPVIHPFILKFIYILFYIKII